ncbi:ribose-5-phosphate isomerase B [bacterium BMS3Abin01]|nr:ribose-5-phosphate isomerase B [bacterium BMS3Abin01]HDY69381.1 ribose 5-phosphate isomerase B [Actinomycetota bacterium]
MKIALAADHAGYELKQTIMERLRNDGHQVIDLGTDSSQSVDYPHFAIQVSRAVSSRRADRGLLFCGTGLGMCITANKVAGIRAVSPCDISQAEMSRRHNDANILCLGQRTLEQESIFDILDVWMSTPFEGGRHERRLNIIAELEENWQSPE